MLFSVGDGFVLWDVILVDVMGVDDVEVLVFDMMV